MRFFDQVGRLDAPVGWSQAAAGLGIALEEADTLRVHAVAPGVIETDMQAGLRSKDESTFPDVARFVQLHESAALASPKDAARRLLALAFDPAARRDAVCVDVRT